MNQVYFLKQSSPELNHRVKKLALRQRQSRMQVGLMLKVVVSDFLIKKNNCVSRIACHLF